MQAFTGNACNSMWHKRVAPPGVINIKPPCNATSGLNLLMTDVGVAAADARDRVRVVNLPSSLL